MDLYHQVNDYYDKGRQFYEWADTLSDPRVSSWPWVSSPVPVCLSAIIYVIFSWKVGPWMMKDRAPFELKKLMMVYNISMSYLSFYIFKELLLGMLDADYSWPCQPLPLENNPKNMRIAAGVWWFFIAKPLEYMDTVFFVLRKRQRQISFLHVYHHATISVWVWVYLKWLPGGQTPFYAIGNAFIHIIMYGYYGLSALGPEYQKYLWWKKYLTQMQLIQFCIFIGIATYEVFHDCGAPLWMSYATMIYATSFLLLFGNFYLQSYIEKKRGTKFDATNNGHCAKEISNENANEGLASKKSDEKQD